MSGAVAPESAGRYHLPPMEAPLDGTRSPRLARGFTLIEIVVVLFILGVVIAMAAAITSALTASQRLSTTTTRMQTVDAAIVQFVMQKSDCLVPRTGRSLRPIRECGSQETQDDIDGVLALRQPRQNGVVPWADARLEPSRRDGWLGSSAHISRAAGPYCRQRAGHVVVRPCRRRVTVVWRTSSQARAPPSGTVSAGNTCTSPSRGISAGRRGSRSTMWQTPR